MYKIVRFEEEIMKEEIPPIVIKDEAKWLRVSIEMKRRGLKFV